MPEGTKRVRIFGRVNPATVRFFRSLNEANDGRAMDRTVHLARGMQNALEEMGDHKDKWQEYHGNHYMARGMQAALEYLDTSGFLEEQTVALSPDHKPIGSTAF